MRRSERIGDATDGGIGGLRCRLYIILSLPLVS